MIRSITAAATAVATALLAPLAAVAADAPSGSAVASAADAPVSVTLTSFSSAVVEPGSGVGAAVSVYNPAAQAIEGVVVSMHVTAGPLDSIEALDAFLDDPHASPLTRVTQEPEPPEPAEDEDAPEGDAADQDPEPEGLTVGPGARESVMVSAGADDLDLPAGEWGVYGIVIEVEVGGTTYPVEALPVTWADAQVPQLPVTVLATAQGQPNRVDAVLRAAGVPGVAVALDPTNLTTAQVFEHELVSREVLRLPSGDPDLTSLAHGQDESVLALALDSPASTALGSFGSAPWLAQPGAIDASTTAFATAHGAVATLAVPGAPGYADAAAAGAPVVAGPEGESVLVADARLSETLAQFRPGTDAARTVLVAQSALTADAGQSQAVLIAPGRSWQLGSTETSAALEALVEAPWVQMRSVAELLESSAGEATLEGTLDTDQDLPAQTVAALGGRLEGLWTLSSAAEDPESALVEWGAPVVEAVPTSLRGEGIARDAAVTAGLAAADEVLGGLRIAASSDLNLLADSGDIPITVVNELDRPVTVTVELTSLSPNLQVQSRPVVTVPQGEEVMVPVTVEAVSSANVELRAVLRTVTGVAISDVQQFSVRVRADWGTAATAVFSVLLVMLMIAGIVRTIRRGRKDTRTSPGAAPATAPEEPLPVPDEVLEDPTDDAREAESGDHDRRG